jgi:uncharacterized protein (DUF1800 family)
MKLNRRKFIQTGAALSLPLVLPVEGLGALSANTSVFTEKYSGVLPSPEVCALHRMAFGPRPADVDRVKKMGLSAYIEEQLHPDERLDVEVQQRIDRAVLDIKYEAGEKYKAVDEVRPLTKWNKSLKELWPQMEGVYDTNYQEWIRPAAEIAVVTWIRGVYSKWQLREVMAEFWHDHFNVSISSHAAIGITMPSYDRDVIRKNAFGNFRVFLEDVAKSPAMLHYLNNKSSKSGPANENYARELFELHTMGAENYYNHLYNKWKEVPGALEEKPIGYIDQDVYEAARAFTGWTVADGSRTWKGEEQFLNTGEFYYHDGWHDDYQKRILGVEFDPHQPPMADGKKVLDLVAAHPGTIKRLCRKICQRLVSDNPPETLISKAEKVWKEQYHAPDQIAQVLRVILNSDEFKFTFGEKIKRPFEVICSFLRATEAEVTPTMGFVWGWACAGEAKFQWPTPTGKPDVASYWSSSESLMSRWRSIGFYLSWKNNPFVQLDLLKATPIAVDTPRKLLDFWIERLLGRKIPEERYRVLADYLTAGGSLDAVIQDRAAAGPKLDGLVGLIAMSPDFQWR